MLAMVGYSPLLLQMCDLSAGLLRERMVPPVFQIALYRLVGGGIARECAASLHRERQFMGENRRDQTQVIGLSAARVAAAAIQQAARHERALLACLSELEGYDDTPSDELVQAVRKRATRHAGRAVGLVRTAIRLNPDPLTEATFAALLERHERNGLLAERWTPASPFDSFGNLPLAS